MARDCYKRQQGTPQTVLKQSTTTIEKKPALIEFQQFPTFVKRHLEGENEDNNRDDEEGKEGNNLNSLTDATSVESSSTTMEEYDPKETTLTWGHTQAIWEDQDHIWGHEPKPKAARHNSPERNAYRPSICQFCDIPVGSKKDEWTADLPFLSRTAGGR
jgi:hypothetical protein